MTKAGGSIQTFSESTHIEALIKACKMMKIKKKSYLYNSTGRGHPDHLLHRHPHRVQIAAGHGTTPVLGVQTYIS